MNTKYPYLSDSEFLHMFDELKLKQQYVKIIVLNFNEHPIQQITGHVLTGNINLDSSSGMRRTATINFLTDKEENNLTTIQNLLSINKKISIEIGFKNTTDQYEEYPIIWFPEGVYVIINPVITHDTTNINISLTLHDKMALLNGECGGTLPASVIFHQREENDGSIIKPTIFQIIQELVNHFGGEELGKIFINDVDDKIKQVMRWSGSKPLYFYSNEGQNIFTTKRTGEPMRTYTYGDDVGYILTDFTYPGELIGNIGDTVVTILDQIKNTLGNYEYFYDLDGNFIFQEIKNYLNTSYSTTILDNQDSSIEYKNNYINHKTIYSFDNANIIQSFSNTPQYQQIKNDFIVWGKRTTIDNVTLPIRYHLAIDEKPIQPYPTYTNMQYYTEDDVEKVKKVKNGGINITPVDFRTALYLQGVNTQQNATYSNYYYTELKNEWPKLYDIRHEQFYNNVKNNPDTIDFFLDFIDAPEALSEFSIQNIGRRTQTIVDDNINCIFEPSHSNLILIEAGRGTQTRSEVADCEIRHLQYVQVPTSIYSLLNTGGVARSAYEEIRKELYQYTSYNEQVSLTVLPIYYLEPNTRIHIQDNISGIYGDFMIKTISIPLDINSNMSITCTKALERI